MKTLVIVLGLFLSGTSFGQSARDYYNELYKAGGLDRMADGDVCFDDRPELPTFFIFGQSKYLKQFLEEKKGFKLSPADKAQLDRGFLNVRGYDKGVVIGPEQYFMKDDDSWITDTFFLNHNTPARMRLTISWQTLRYKRSIEILNRDSSVKSVAISNYGKCEDISPTVEQKGN